MQQIATSPNENLCKELFNRGAAGSGRDDDNPETLHKRFVTYNKDTMPMVDHLEKEGLLRRIDAKRTIDEVYEVSSWKAILIVIPLIWLIVNYAS